MKKRTRSLNAQSRATALRAAVLATPAILALGGLGSTARAADGTFDGGADPAGGAGTAWLTVTNWVGDAAFAGSSSTTTNTDIATFGTLGSATTIGINMNTTVGVFYLGAIDDTGNTARSIGNSSSTVPGTLTLNGATVNAVSNTILHN